MKLLSAFNPHEFSPSTVRTIATARETELADILATIRSNLSSDTTQHLILSAPRGYGKSFMMRYVQIEADRIARDEELPLATLLMPEEMPHVREPETFLRELVRTLKGGAGGDAELTWHEDDGAAWDAACTDLTTAIQEKIGPEGILVILVENFDEMLRRAFSKPIQVSRLRMWLADPAARIMMIAASASGAIDRNYDDRLFQAFREIELKPWQIEECLTFFDRQRQDAGQPPLSPPARARAKAVASFIGGTPRLATLLGDALFDEDILRAADLLHRLVDELTPYYKHRIETLPGRSQKLLDALLRGGEPATQSELAKRVNANSQAAIAGPFRDLVLERMVEGLKAPDSAEILYRVSDRIFAHYYRRRIIAHGNDACPLEGLTDLLAEFFSPEEKRTKAIEFFRNRMIPEYILMANLYSLEKNSEIQKNISIMLNGIENYIANRLRPMASQGLKDSLLEIGNNFKIHRFIEAENQIENLITPNLDMKDRVLLEVIRSKLQAIKGIDWGLPAIELALEMARKCDSQEHEIITEIEMSWSRYYLKQYTTALEISSNAARKAERLNLSRDVSAAHCISTACLWTFERYDDGLVSARESYRHSQKANEPEQKLAARIALAASLLLAGEHEESISFSEEALKDPTINQNAALAIIYTKNVIFSSIHAGKLKEALQRTKSLHDIRASDTHSTKDPIVDNTMENIIFLISRIIVKILQNQEGTELLYSILSHIKSIFHDARYLQDITSPLIVSLVTELIEQVAFPEILISVADAVDVYFPDQFSLATQWLQDAARYHASQRSAARLARIDPDLAKVLRVMFPPSTSTPSKRTPKRSRHK